MKTYLEKMADVIINYSTAVQPGERVLLRGTSPAAEPLIQALYQAALRAGGQAFTYIHLRDEDSLAIEATGQLDLLAAVNPMLKLMYETCQVIVRVEASENPRALSDYPPERQKARLQAMAGVMSIQMEREGQGTLRRCTTQFPTQAYAQAAGMSLRQYERFVFEACKLHLADPVAAWQEVEQSQQRLIDYLAGKKHLHARGPNIDLQMSIEGRPFLNATGKINFPDGEIFTGPVEDSVNGWVKFTYPAYYHDNEVIGARLTFENGLVTQATADKNEAFLQNTLDTDPGARRLGEFAIGANNDIQRFTGSILFDEKIGGTVHLAVGQGYPQSGSTNTSAVHWDMICDMREGGEIWVDGELFYRNGDFLKG
ncbi:MAG: aminopeptidase [Anaerolineae bacterium]|nr:aminopeptidase [Anaerolineales bacterium]MCQ3972176.1 aminopeptidase [Anaerolineae bacterium]